MLTAAVTARTQVKLANRLAASASLVIGQMVTVLFPVTAVDYDSDQPGLVGSQKLMAKQ